MLRWDVTIVWPGPKSAETDKKMSKRCTCRCLSAPLIFYYNFFLIGWEVLQIKKSSTDKAVFIWLLKQSPSQSLRALWSALKGTWALGTRLLLIIIDLLRHAQTRATLSFNQKIKTNHDVRAHDFSGFASVACIRLSFDWFTVLSVSSVIGQSNNFGFDFTTLLKTVLTFSQLRC